MINTPKIIKWNIKIFTSHQSKIVEYEDNEKVYLYIDWNYYNFMRWSLSPRTECDGYLNANFFSLNKWTSSYLNPNQVSPEQIPKPWAMWSVLYNDEKQYEDESKKNTE